jgi:hypothetical protein
VLDVVLAGGEVFLHRLISQEINGDEKNDQRDEIDQKTPEIRKEFIEEIIGAERRVRRAGRSARGRIKQKSLD